MKVYWLDYLRRDRFDKALAEEEAGLLEVMSDKRKFHPKIRIISHLKMSEEEAWLEIFLYKHVRAGVEWIVSSGLGSSI